MKKLFILFLIVLSFSLTGCLGFGGTQTAYKPTFEGKEYTNQEFSMFVATEFETITNFDTSYPPETIAGFRNKTRTDNFYSNINIIKIGVSANIDALKLASQKIQTHQNSLGNFKKISEQSIELIVKGQPQKTMLYYFEGEPKSDKKMRYYQTYAVLNNQAFILTGAFSTKETDNIVKKIEGMLKSFSLL